MAEKKTTPQKAAPQRKAVVVTGFYDALTGRDYKPGDPAPAAWDQNRVDHYMGSLLAWQDKSGPTVKK